MAQRKQLERRTFLQDRFEILIKRQKNGEATFNELTELDEIVNRDPEIREKVIRESMLMDETKDFEWPAPEQKNQTETPARSIERQSLFTRLKLLVSRIFNFQALSPKTRNAIPGSAILVLL
jgi:hypothetical protein